jgi:hypothetical protein
MSFLLGALPAVPAELDVAVDETDQFRLGPPFGRCLQDRVDGAFDGSLAPVTACDCDDLSGLGVTRRPAPRSV